MTKSDQLARNAEEVARILKQLAHPVRLKILCCLEENEKTVTHIVEHSGASQSWVSQFLARMKLEGLIASRREGSFVYYRIADPRLSRLLKSVREIYCKE